MSWRRVSHDRAIPNQAPCIYSVLDISHGEELLASVPGFWDAFCQPMDTKTVSSALRFLLIAFEVGIVAIVSFILGLLVQQERTKELIAELRRLRGD